MYARVCLGRAPQSFTLSESLIEQKEIANGWQIDLADAVEYFNKSTGDRDREIPLYLLRETRAR